MWKYCALTLQEETCPWCATAWGVGWLNNSILFAEFAWKKSLDHSRRKHQKPKHQNWISDVVRFLSTKNIMFSFKFQGTLCIRETSMKRGAMRESKDLFILDKGLTIYVVICHSMNNPLPIIGKSTKKEWTNQYLPCWQWFTFAWLHGSFPQFLCT